MAPLRTTSVPLRHRNPPDVLLGPDIEPVALKGVFLRGGLLGFLAILGELLLHDDRAQRRVSLPPRLGLRPVILLTRCPDHGEERVIVDRAIKDLTGAEVLLVADRLPVVACGADAYQQRLPAGSTPIPERIPKLPGLLGVKLVEDQPVDVQPLSGVGLVRDGPKQAIS